MGSIPSIAGFSPQRRSGLLASATVLGCGLLCGLVLWSRVWHFSADPLPYLYIEVAGSLLSFSYAANGFVRFRSTQDRLSLILAFGFVISGTIESLACFRLYDSLSHGSAELLHIPMSWMVSRVVLGTLLIAAVLVERRIPNAREPGREIAGALLLVALAAYVTSTALLASPGVLLVRPGALIPRPWDLFPAGIFGVAALLFWNRLRLTASGLDHVFFWASILNAACHLAASLSARPLDGPFTLANTLKISSYALMFGGALLDNARLFDHVRQLAISDPLTGLGNYRRLLNVVENEIERSSRTGRTFAVILFDMDRLKSINDRFGHLVGSRALIRLGNTLRQHCRAMDTAARYGGDEFAVVLPEASAEVGEGIVRRICQRLTADGELPLLSVSAGVAVYPQDGDTAEKLLGAADRALYGMKDRSAGVDNLRRFAACL